ncbi:MAG: cupredoxin domain-containing protein [Candidatus Andersenbacteria bacterium]|nr:cupredoxin domain-containing protein [Candidatus Andersenbacteria bacterium]
MILRIDKYPDRLKKMIHNKLFMKKSLWLVGLIVLIVVAGAWYWQKGRSVDMSSDEIGSVMREINNGDGQVLLREPSQLPVDDQGIGEMMDGGTVADEGNGEVMGENGAVAEEVTVDIGDTGFTPATVTVAAGTKVTFVNNGQAAHWPASDPHPVHTDLPGFDAKHGLQTGEEYSFVFDKVGSWGFHDHLNPTLTGEIVVSSK